MLTSGRTVLIGLMNAPAVTVSINPYYLALTPVLSRRNRAPNGADASIVQLTADCRAPATWTAVPLPTAALNAPISNVMENLKGAKSGSAGLYSMPFTVKIKRMDGQGCP